MSKLFYLPFRPVFNSRGLPVGGAKAFFYKSGTTELAAVYADSDLATPLTNPVVTDGLGQLRNIYLRDDAVYRVRIVDRNGLALGTDIDPYYPGQAVINTPDLPELIAADGSSKVGFRQNDVGAVTLRLDGLLNRTRRAQSFGLVQSDGNSGNGQAAALQRGIDAASSYNVGLGGHLEIPWGLYYLDASLTVSDYTSLRGEGPRATILYNEQHPLNAPAILLGSSVQVGFTEIEGIGFRGYTAGIRVLGATDGLAFRRLHMLRCTYGILLEGLLQTTMIDEVEFDACPTAIFSTSAVANRVTVNQCGFKNCTNSLVVLAGAEDFLFIGARFEGGGMLGKSTLDFGAVRLIAFIGGYMESTHQYAMRLVNSPGGVVSFTGFHWTGTGVKNTDLSYEWLVDGTGTIVFRDCQCTYPMRIPPNSRVEGECPGLIRSEWRGSDRRMPYRPASTTFDICKFTRPDAVNDPTNFNNLSGVLTISGLYSSADGGIFGTFNRRIPFNLNTQGSADVTYTAGAEIAVNTGSGANFAVSATGASPSMIMLRGAIAGVSAGALAVFQVGFEIEWDQFATLGDGLRNNFSVEKQ
ncbi:hypothetical protein QP164_00155 [Sphingomonas sp. LR59]|uniref:hypothetical protein n=1 Tax=Sphingomonas sp. LR59 TaxID=3050232 RepID=UPI002FDF2509